MSNFFEDFLSAFVPDNKKYLTYREGKTNILLTAPHGGSIQPISIPRRKYGNRSRDTYTRTLIQRILELSKDKPYFVFANIHRSRIDLNREIEEACQGNSKMEQVWNDWTRLVKEYQNNIRFYYKKGLYIDIHSHNNSNQFQIGYGLSVRDYLALLDDNKIPTKNSTMHSLKELAPEYYMTEHNVLFGKYSIPKSLEMFGYKVLIPKNDKDYLNGGRNIKEFHGDGIGAMQIECPISVLRNDLDKVANCLVYGINRFKEKFLE